jgi:membrane protease YdiL (CAAX protease family)
MTHEVHAVIENAGSDNSEFEYHRVHLVRRRGSGAWRPLLGALLAAVLTFGVAQVFWLVVFILGGALAGGSLREVAAGLTDLTDPSPWTLAYLMVSLASAIPIVWFVSWLFHGQHLGWVTSVVGRMRWRWLLRCTGLSVIALVATLAVSALVPVEASGVPPMSLQPMTETILGFALVVVLLVPFQAAAEEYLFRGYLTQAFGGLFAHPVVARGIAVLVPALLFALAHGAQDPPVFVDRLAFGLVAGVLVIVTGGLEAAIAMHVLNNFVAFGLALAFTDIGTALNPTGGTWWSLPATLTQSFVYLGLAWFWARRTGVQTAGVGPVLVSRRGPV